jgi:hypothetical protein
MAAGDNNDWMSLPAAGDTTRHSISSQGTHTTHTTHTTQEQSSIAAACATACKPTSSGTTTAGKYSSSMRIDTSSNGGLSEECKQTAGSEEEEFIAFGLNIFDE